MLKEKGITLMALCVTIVGLTYFSRSSHTNNSRRGLYSSPSKTKKKNVETKQNMEQSYINSLEEELKKEKNTI